MSSTSQLTVTSTSEKHQNKSNLHTLPCDGLSNLLHLSSSPTTNSKYLYYVNAEPKQKQPVIPQASTHARGKLSTISLPVPWYKRTRSPSDDKPPKMSRDRLLPLDKLFHSASNNNNNSNNNNDDDQGSPTNDLIPLDESLNVNEKNPQKIKENGYLRNPAHLVTR